MISFAYSTLFAYLIQNFWIQDLGRVKVKFHAWFPWRYYEYMEWTKPYTRLHNTVWITEKFKRCKILGNGTLKMELWWKGLPFVVFRSYFQMAKCTYYGSRYRTSASSKIDYNLCNFNFGSDNLEYNKFNFSKFLKIRKTSWVNYIFNEKHKFQFPRSVITEYSIVLCWVKFPLLSEEFTLLKQHTIIKKWIFRFWFNFPPPSGVIRGLNTDHKWSTMRRRVETR